MQQPRSIALALATAIAIGMKSCEGRADVRRSTCGLDRFGCRSHMIQSVTSPKVQLRGSVQAHGLLREMVFVIVTRRRGLLLVVQQHAIEVGDRAGQTFVEFHVRFPAQRVARECDIRTTLQRIILRQRAVHDARPRSGQLDDPVSQFLDGELVRIAQIDRAGEVVAGRHQTHEAIDQVIDIAEGARLPAVAVKRDLLAAQGLNDEVGHHPAVVRVHARAVGVEDARHLDAGRCCRW